MQTQTLQHDCNVTTFATYLISTSLAFGSDLLRFLDTHASAFGVMLGFATFCVNFYFQRKNSKVLISKNSE